MTTIYDVARRAGVSPATVSRFMNGHSVRPEAAGRIRAAVDELAYNPSRAARTLRTKRVQVLALIIPDIENPHFTSIARGAEDEARAAGYSLVLCNTDEDAEQEARYVDVVAADHMAGAIIAPVADGEAVAALVRHGCPVVSVDRHVRDVATDSVTVDNVEFGRQATRRLIDAGARRIACITGPERAETARDRAEGWARALGDGADRSLLRWADFRVDGGRTALRDLLRERADIDAVVVANNLMAVGALAELRALGASGDVRLSAIGALPYSDGEIERVSTLELPARELGTTAARLLLRRIQGDDGDPRNVVIRPRQRPAAPPADPVTP